LGVVAVMVLLMPEVLCMSAGELVLDDVSRFELLPASPPPPPPPQAEIRHRSKRGVTCKSLIIALYQ